MKRAESYLKDDDSNYPLAKKSKQFSNLTTSATCSFDVVPVSSFNVEFPLYRQPVEIGSFSLNCDRSYVGNRSQLRLYRPPRDIHNLNWNLCHGYETFIQRDETIKEYLDHLLQWIMENKDQVGLLSSDITTNAKLDCLNVDFVCWRGLLTKLLCTPYENREGWKLSVCRFGRTLYMCEYEDESSANDYKNSDVQKKMTYWGFKFESYVTCDKSQSSPDVDQPVNNKQAYVSVVRTRLHSHSLVFGGEVDCCEPSNNSKYIELKTSRQLEALNQRRNFIRYKLIKWWAQSFLIGIPKIVCGFRDDDGIVRYLQEYMTVDLPKHCKEVQNGWLGNVCFNFLDKFLQHIKTVVTQDCNRAVYVFSWSPRQPVTCCVKEPQSEFSFLPNWYTGSREHSRPQSSSQNLNYS